MKLKAALLGATASLVLAPMAFAEGHEGERGRDGEVKIIYWQAPSIMNPYLSGGTKDLEAASLVIEPLARYNEDGDMVPWLAESVPTVENGGVNEDLTQITWKLKEGLLWSDGTPVTSADAKFTWEYCTAEGGGCAQSEKYNDVTSVETPDDRTIVVNFGVPKPFPYGPFVGAQAPIIQAAQFADCLGPKAPECTEANFQPIGTGPFVVSDFRPNDVISLVANENYREEGKPAFASVTFKGGGDATAAGRSVLETGEFDYAWNLQLAPDVLSKMQEAGEGELLSTFGTLVERLEVNLTDPDPALGDQRGVIGNPNPRMIDKAVRQAMSMAIDRPLLVEIGYGDAGSVTCNVLPAPQIYASTANDGCSEQDIEGAKALLEEAGWVDSDGDGVRDREGQSLTLELTTNIDPNRQQILEFLQAEWAEVGIEATVRVYEWPSYIGDVIAGNYQVGLIGWLLLTDPDRATFLQFISEGDQNYGGYANATVDELLVEGRATVDANARRDLYVQAAQTITDEAPYIF
ncbi:MAG: peptide ABC transporter substrate-binding protein, partial [Silicimonas sp.]|nr:peptide ABC transporter substrate-binding protein [Silicimonas sp.]